MANFLTAGLLATQIGATVDEVARTVSRWPGRDAIFPLLSGRRMIPSEMVNAIAAKIQERRSRSKGAAA